MHCRTGAYRNYELIALAPKRQEIRTEQLARDDAEEDNVAVTPAKGRNRFQLALISQKTHGAMRSDARVLVKTPVINYGHIFLCQFISLSYLI